MYPLNACSHWAPTAPSTTLWSQLSVTVICSTKRYPVSLSSSGMTRSSPAPTAYNMGTPAVNSTTNLVLRGPTETERTKMAACGGVMIAENSLIPNIPRLDTVKVPVSRSSSPMFRSTTSCYNEKGEQDSFTSTNRPYPVCSQMPESPNHELQQKCRPNLTEHCRSNGKVKHNCNASNRDNTALQTNRGCPPTSARG